MSFHRLRLTTAYKTTWEAENPEQYSVLHVFGDMLRKEQAAAFCVMNLMKSVNSLQMEIMNKAVTEPGKHRLAHTALFPSVFKAPHSLCLLGWSSSWMYLFCLEGQNQCVRRIYSGHEFACLESQFSHSRCESKDELVCGLYAYVRAQAMNKDDST